MRQYWKLVFTPDADRDLKALSAPIIIRILNKLVWLKNNFDLLKPVPLHGSFSGSYKLKVGDWRIVYRTDFSEKVIIVVMIDHRSKVYSIR